MDYGGILFYFISVFILLKFVFSFYQIIVSYTSFVLYGFDIQQLYLGDLLMLISCSF